MDIRKVWETEQEILDVIDVFCRKYQIRYSLFYGTLLGAVRHQGFIPWDDDIDIVMPRKDYERFVALWRENGVDGYVFQDYHDTPDYPNTFSKLRKDHTTFIQFEEEKQCRYHRGIFVDIFPLDRVAPIGMQRKLQFAASAVFLLYSREYPSGSKGMVGLAEKVLLGVPKKIQGIFKAAAEKFVLRWTDREDLPWFSTCTIQTCTEYFSSTIFEKMERIVFQNKEYSSVSDPDATLRVTYDNYMELPPEEERVWHHHPIIIDFERNYEELSN